MLAWGLFVALIGAPELGARSGFARGLEDARSFEVLADSLMSAGMTRHHVPGGVLVAVRGEEIYFARGYGFAELAHRTPVDPERTIFRMASVSKLLTATACLQLVERGSLALDADVNAYLSRFRVPPSFREPVTLVHLLTHTAGFDDRNLGRKARSAADVDSLGAYLARRLPARIAPPGRYLCYSNHGMALAGSLVEEVSGLTFERYAREHIFTPLNMTRSSFALEPAVPADVAVGYDDSDPPRPEPVEFVRTVPASMMTSTGVDMARFMIAQLKLGRAGTARILSERMAEQMQRRQFSQHPPLPGIAFGFWERFQNGERALWHDGDLAGFASLLYLLPERHTGFFIVFNGSGGGEAREEVLAALLDRYFPERRAIARPVPSADAMQQARRAAGTYVFDRYGHRGIEKIVSLMNQIEAGADSGASLSFRGKRFVAIGPGLFQSLDGRNHLAIELDSGGSVRHLFAGERIARVYERVPWYSTSIVQLSVVGFSVAVFLWTIASAAIVAVFRRLRERASRSWAERLAGRLAVVVALSSLTFLAGFVVALAGFSSQLEAGIPPLLFLLFTIPLLSDGLGVALVIQCARLWNVPSATRGSKVHCSITSLAALAFIAWLAQWNLLGFRF